MRLVLKPGRPDARAYVLVERLRIGRDDDNDVSVPDPSLSRHHAVVTKAADVLWVEDLTSRNGTFVNGERVSRAPINVGDDLRCGTVTFRLEPPGADTPKGLRVGDVVQDRYRIDERIGEGGMGAIFRGTRLADGGAVAVKVVHVPPGAASGVAARHVARFEQELRLTPTVAHPNVVKVFDSGRSDDGDLYLVMELVEGIPFSRVIRKEAPMSPDRVVHLGLQIAGALEAIHRVGVVHRDLKPENVLFVEDPAGDRLKVIDFGLALPADIDTGHRLTDENVRVGTPFYMAPEYIQSRVVDHRCDLYALGVILYAMASGKLPYKGNALEVMLAHIENPVPRLRGAYADAPEWLDELVFALMQKEPDDRLQSATEIVATLKARSPTAAADSPWARAWKWLTSPAGS